MIEDASLDAPHTDRRVTRVNRFLIWAIAAFGLTGCGPEEVLGWVRSVEAPDTVAAEQPFVVTVTTGGPDGCWRKERTEVSVTGLRAIISPYDVDTGETRGITCPLGVVDIVHTAELTFNQAGPGEIIVHGREGSGQELVITVE